MKIFYDKKKIVVDKREKHGLLNYGDLFCVDYWSDTGWQVCKPDQLETSHTCCRNIEDVHRFMKIKNIFDKIMDSSNL